MYCRNDEIYGEIKFLRSRWGEADVKGYLNNELSNKKFKGEAEKSRMTPMCRNVLWVIV